MADRGSWTTSVRDAPEQPIPFSHKHHVKDDGIDCRYCHTGVETSHFAGLPPTETCMTCHSQIWNNATLTQPIRDSWASGKSIEWTRVHDLPDFVLFQPQHPCEQGHRLFYLPWTGKRDAADVQSEHAVHELVHQLPPRPGAVHSAAIGSVQHRLQISGQSSRIGPATGEGIPRSVIDRLRDVPPMRDDTPTAMSALIPLESLLEKPAPPRVNIEALREKLAAGRGPAFWRTLEEAAETEELREYIEQEFPGLSGQIPQGVDRRSLLKVMAASLAMAGAAACTKQPKELIVPYVRQPENVIPGTAAVLRHRDDHGRIRARPAGRKPPEPADQGRRKSRSSGKSRRDHNFRTGFGSEPVRSRPFANRDAEGRHEHLGRFTGSFSTEAQEVGDAQRRGLGDSDGRHHFAYAA